ncbi:GLPGLI family protein [Salegentibacter sp. HM20]
MKNNILLILAFLLVQANLLSQNQEEVEGLFQYRVIYDLHYQTDSTDVDSRRTEEMILYLGENFSRFSSLGKTVNDSLQKSLKKPSFNPADFQRIQSQMPKTDFNYNIYKKRPEGKTFYTEEIVMDNFEYIEDEKLNWNILPEVDTLGGYSVQKATVVFAGRSYTAWFAEEIPIPEGPYKFYGLPGLILKISDAKNHYAFKMVEFKRIPQPFPFTFTEKDYIQTTKSKFLKAKNEFERDRIAYINNIPDVSISVSYDSPADKNRIESRRKEKRKKNNNPIELE